LEHSEFNRGSDRVYLPKYINKTDGPYFLTFLLLDAY
jgi:hypothetical protein